MTLTLRLGRRIAGPLAACLAVATLAAGPALAVTEGRGTADRSGRPAAEEVTALTFRTRVRSADSTLHTLPGGVTYGWNKLVGTTTWGGSPADVEFLGSVSYVDGDGPFTGLVTVTRQGGGASLAFSVAGTALSTANGTSTADASFTGDVRVLGGTGRWARSRGIGTMTGSRTAALGGEVRLTFRLDVVH